MSSSPQSTLCSAGSDDGWDLISAAAGEVMRMKLNQERGLLPPPKPAASTGYFFNPALAQLHNAKVYSFYICLFHNSASLVFVATINDTLRPCAV